MQISTRSSPDISTLLPSTGVWFGSAPVTLKVSYNSSNLSVTSHAHVCFPFVSPLVSSGFSSVRHPSVFFSYTVLQVQLRGTQAFYDFLWSKVSWWATFNEPPPGRFLNYEAKRGHIIYSTLNMVNLVSDFRNAPEISLLSFSFCLNL